MGLEIKSQSFFLPLLLLLLSGCQPKGYLMSSPMDWWVIASGHRDRLLYEKGVLYRNLPFEKLRKRSRVDLRMQDHGEYRSPMVLRKDLPKNYSSLEIAIS